jgi:hypothetical protein
VLFAASWRRNRLNVGKFEKWNLEDTELDSARLMDKWIDR